ncbi:MAG: hypothetical protein AAF598_19170, partial [Bacteroidota bacterium]
FTFFFLTSIFIAVIVNTMKWNSFAVAGAGLAVTGFAIYVTPVGLGIGGFTGFIVVLLLLLYFRIS